tara:strand:+ start:9335 stop:10240 length:906 start_codon:yes stop_codon:yes gene_type:complete
MLPDNFDFAQIPDEADSLTLKEVGMLASDIENIDYSVMSWMKEDLALMAMTNQGFTNVPVLWQTPERAYQIKNKKELRDDNGSLTLPIVSIERTNIAKDPARKGGFQAHLYSAPGEPKNKNGALNGTTGRMVIGRRIKQDKTRNFAVAQANRNRSNLPANQLNTKRKNKRIIVQTLSIPIPVYINVDYKIIIKTEYQQQMNDLMSPFITKTGQINAFVMRRNGHLYEAFVDQSFTHNNNVSNMNEDIRMFTSEINLRVLGYLMGEGKNDDRPIVRVDENFVEVSYPRETVPRPGDPDFFGS